MCFHESQLETAITMACNGLGLVSLMAKGGQTECLAGQACCLSVLLLLPLAARQVEEEVQPQLEKHCLLAAVLANGDSLGPAINVHSSNLNIMIRNITNQSNWSDQVLSTGVSSVGSIPLAHSSWPGDISSSLGPTLVKRGWAVCNAGLQQL